MAGIGAVGSFATDIPLQRNYVGEAMAEVENNAFKRREEQRLAQAKKKAEDDEKLKELEDYNKRFGVNLTGVQSLDDTTLPYAMQAKQKAQELTKQIYATTDFNKKSELMSQRAKIVQSFDVLKQVPDMIIKQGQEIAKGVEEGKYNPDDVNMIQEKFKALESGKVHYYTDDYGNLRYTLYKLDAQGNPTGIIEKDQPVAELSKSLTPHLKSNFEDLLKKTVENTAVKETEIQNGLKTTTKKGVEDAVKMANATSFGELIANTPNEAYAIGRRFGIDPNDKQAISQKAQEQYINALDSTLKVKFDLSEQRLRAENARKNKKEDEDTTPVIGTGTITSREGVVDGTNFKVPQGSKTFAISKAERKLGDGKIQRLKEVRVLPNGKLAFVTEETYETESKTSSRLTPQGEKNIAKFLKENPEKKESDYIYKFGDAENVSAKNAKPKIVVYDTGRNADDAEGLAIMLKNPTTGENFSGLNEAVEFFKDKANGITNGKQLTAEELIAKYKTKK